MSATAEAIETKTKRIGVLTLGDLRKEAIKGFMEGMSVHGEQNHAKYIYEVKDADGKRALLTTLADEIVAAQPDIIIAAGGVEADALKVATLQNKIPVVFLVVSSSVSRGLAESLKKPGGNMTGIDTNDTLLTEKRLWYIKKLFPEVHNVLSFNVPTIAPSVDSIKIARAKAPDLKLAFSVIDVHSKADIPQAAATVTQNNTDAILLNPCAPVNQSIKTILLPLSLEQKIPIFGYSAGDVTKGAVASYGPSRYGIGKQGARLAIKVLHGANPATLPVESPEDLELTINRHMVERLGLELPTRAWKLANQIVDQQP